KEFLSVDDHLAVAEIRPLVELNATTQARERIGMTMLTVFSVIALVLAAVGIYGLMSHSIQQRTHELGVRISLGATAGDIFKLIMADAVKLTVSGMFAGVLGAIGLTRLLSSLLFNVKSTDPLTFFSVCLVLGLVALTAAYIPARRAIAINPVIALRME